MTFPTWLAPWCAFAAAATYDSLAAPVVARAKLAMLDTLGAIAAGHQEPEVQALVRRLATPTGAGAPVIGTRAHADPATAALLNGIAGTSLELDEGNRFARGHPAIHVLPAALVAGQRLASSGRELLLAFALGYEIAARIGAAANLRPGFHPHGTWGVVGAALAVARLHGADAARLAETINIASSLSLATSMRTAIEGGTVRNAYAGVANQLGLLAWDLAASGFTGERDGVATVFGQIAGRDFKPEAMTEALGSRWEVARNYFKRHACCRYNHGMLDALEILVAENGTIAADDVAEVTVETYAAAAELADPRPRNALAAKFSLPFAAAAFLVRGAADMPAFRAEARGDAAILDLAARVHVREEPGFTARLPAARPARVAVALRDGRRLVAETMTNRGDADSPYPVAEIEAKFLTLAADGWSEPRARSLMASVLGLEDAPDIRAFCALLTS
ncbi:MAG: MmgE/PrpD family protein [Alphaproteobacteria bacterium]|nr:MmgE/PrpD family protein [Alphaproteobacteria bacterium]